MHFLTFFYIFYSFIPSYFIEALVLSGLDLKQLIFFLILFDAFISFSRKHPIVLPQKVLLSGCYPETHDKILAVN